MISKTMKVTGDMGIHLRIACEIMEIVNNVNCVLFAKKANSDAERLQIKSPIMLASVGGKRGDDVEFSLLGEEHTSLQALKEIGRII
ncbi:MAG: HPr family phosphocarrier protein [Bacillota bacterium]